MNNELFNFRDPKELRRTSKSMLNGIVGLAAMGTVVIAALGTKELIDKIQLNTQQPVSATIEEKNCKPSEPFKTINLPGGDAVVQVVERRDTVDQTTKMGWLCIRLVSTDDNGVTPRHMSLVVTPEIKTPVEPIGDTGEYSRYTDWVVVEPNTPVKVAALVGVPESIPSDLVSVSVGFSLLYPAESISGSVSYGDPIISDEQHVPVALIA